MAKDDMDVRQEVARLLTGRCNNCYSKLPGEVGCSVHSPGWHWLTPNFGPFCDDCWKEVVGPREHDRIVSVDAVISQRAERLYHEPGAAFAVHEFRAKLAELRRHAPEGDLNFRLWVYR